jgi:hypothetical protein
MSSVEVITKERHAGKRWRKPKGYQYAVANTLAPICPSELALACSAMPLAFVKEGDSYHLVAVLSPVPGKNMFVAPNGSWLGTYIPAVIRGYPFRLARNAQTNDFALAIDESVGITAAEEPETEPFFKPDGTPAATTQMIIDMLTQIQAQLASADRVVALVSELGLLQPWHLKVQTEQGDQEMTGLYRLDEAAMNGLSDNEFLRLKSAGALSLAYAQLLSMSQTAMFSRLAQLHAQFAPPRANPLPDNLDKLFGLAADDMLKFD